MMTNNWRCCCLGLILSLASLSPAFGAEWRPIVLPVELTVGYAVQTLDLSGDGKLDIAIVDSKRIVWLEAPNWTTHVIWSTPTAPFDNVCFSPRDIDGDGDIDFAVGHDWQFGNSDSGGQMGWLRSPANPREPWEYFPIAQEPTIHRMRWIQWNDQGPAELVVAPLKGRNSRPPAFKESGVRLMAFKIPSDPTRDPWPMRVLEDQLHVMHNIDIVDWKQDGQRSLLTASFEGVHHHTPDASGNLSRVRLGTGHQGEAPALGSSEIRLGRLASAARYIATIEPWHGDQVVVYTEPASPSPDGLWKRHVLDQELKWGHAVACANLDQDPDQELVIGVRDEKTAQHRCGVRIYDPIDAAAGQWQRTLVAPGQVAVEDMVTGDLDGDGDQDIVAVGRATHNAVIYFQD